MRAQDVITTVIERRGGAPDEPPETFPGWGYYEPSISGSATAGTLPMTDAEKLAAAIRASHRGAFGFARALQEPQRGAPS